jgi:hypothetical protein
MESRRQEGDLQATLEEKENSMNLHWDCVLSLLAWRVDGRAYEYRRTEV